MKKLFLVEKFSDFHFNSLHSFEIAIIYVIKTRIYILKYVIIQAHFIDIFRHLWYNIYRLLISERDGIISKIGYIRVSTAEQETARQEELSYWE